jgi:hypothetical protein
MSPHLQTHNTRADDHFRHECKELAFQGNAFTEKLDIFMGGIVDIGYMMFRYLRAAWKSCSESVQFHTELDVRTENSSKTYQPRT